MKKILTFVIAVISLCGLFTILKSDNAYAATNSLLEKGKVYYYDLDGDGNNEKIYYQTHVSAKDNEFFDSVSLFINDKNVYTKEITDTWVSYKVIDFDTSDKTIELNLQIGSYSYTVDYSSFQRWNGKEIVEFETKKDNGFAYIKTKTGKKGWIFLSKKMSGWGKKTLFKQVPGWG